jgi:hypothetical protein
MACLTDSCDCEQTVVHSAAAVIQLLCVLRGSVL